MELIKTGQALTSREGFGPFTLMLIFSLIPVLRQEYSFVLLNRAGWTFDTFYLVKFFSILLSNLAVLSGVSKIGKYLKYNIILAGCIILLCFYQLVSSSVIFCERFNQSEFAVIYTLIDFTWIMSIKMFYITVTGRISKFLPEGFESTGVTFIISCFNFTQTFGQYLSSVILQSYDVKAGYYGRLESPQLVGIGLGILLNFICPLFLPS